MGGFGGVPFERDEARGGEAFEDSVDVAGSGECGQLVAGDATLGVGDPFAGFDHAQQDGPEEVAVAIIEGGVELLGGLGERAPNSAGGAIAGDGEGAALATQPGFAQCVGDEGERSRLGLGRRRGSPR